MKQLKDDNSGLSLIEVLVAMMILAIVVTPFLRSFVTSANANSKAKQMHKATTLAQSVMEGIKAEELKNLSAQFNYPAKNWRLMDLAKVNGVVELAEDTAGSLTIAGKYEDIPAAVADKKSLMALWDIHASVYSEDGGENYEFMSRDGDKYYFVLDDVTVDKGTYDVLITVDADVTAADIASNADKTTAEVAGADATQYHNAQSWTKLPVLDEEKDAICTQLPAYTDRALTDCEVPSLDDLRRTITVTIEHTFLGGTVWRTRVLVTYLYQNRSDYSKQYKKTVVQYDSTVNEEELRAVYLYYTPLYPASFQDDVIEFVNNDNLPVDFYLFKQEITGLTRTTAQTAADPLNKHLTTTATEQSYEMRFNILCSSAGDPVDFASKIYTNLYQDITVNNGTVPEAHCHVFYNASSYDLKANTTGIMDTDRTNRVYDVQVSVYRSDAYKVQAGTAVTDFSNDKLLTSLTGNLLD